MSQSGEAYEIIDARNDLKGKVREITGDLPDEDPVARADAALAALSQHFEGWMEDEVSTIARNRDKWVSAGLTEGEPREAFFRSVHDLKGQAATLGFPLAASVAAGLCRLLERLDPAELPPRHLVDGHVEAIRAIFRERARDETDRVGTRLVEALDHLVEGFLAERGRAGADDR